MAKLPEGRSALTDEQMIGLTHRLVDTCIDCKGRIEELEANLAEQIEWVKRLADNLIAAEEREAKAVVTLSLTRRADDLREAYHRLPNEKCRIGEKRSKKSHARDAWMRAFRQAAREARTTLAELTGGKDAE